MSGACENPCEKPSAFPAHWIRDEDESSGMTVLLNRWETSLPTCLCPLFFKTLLSVE